MTQLDDAIARGRTALLSYRTPAGWFNSPVDFGVWTAAQAAVTLAFTGALAPEEARAITIEILESQLPDGSWAPWPDRREGDVCATTMAWSALVMCQKLTGGLDAPIARARAWVEAHGGTDAVPSSFLEDPLLTRVFAAVAGVMPASAVPPGPMFPIMVPSLTRLIENRVDEYTFIGMMQVGAIRHYLNGDWGENGEKRGILAGAECLAGIRTLLALQQTDGGWNGISTQTCFTLVSLVALGLGPEAPAMQLGIGWLRGTARPTPRGGLAWTLYRNELWTTALALRALMEVDGDATSPEVSDAARRIVEASKRVHTLKADTGDAPVPESGGFGFEADNTWFPDCDDTGVVLSGLGPVLAAAPDRAVPPLLADRLRETIDHTIRWLEAMQNPNGGWPSYVHGMPSKPVGMMYQSVPDLSTRDPLQWMKLLRDPPPELGQPSLEGVTGRILLGLAWCGWDLGSPAAQKAITFLRTMQEADGSWWSMWMVNYLPGTASVLWALARIGLPATDPAMTNAMGFLYSRQNDDGGWGELPASYTSPQAKARGPSMPALTGWVLSALMACGERGPAIERGIAWLLSAQEPDGHWRRHGWLHTYQPPARLYTMPCQTQTQALEALATWRKLQAGQLVAVRSDELPWSLARVRATIQPIPPEAVATRLGQWSGDFLELARGVGDPPTDALMAEVYADAGEGGDTRLPLVNQVLRSVVSTQTPPDDRVPALAEWWRREAVLPTGADAEAIEAAQRVFVRHGWASVIVLFFSSLPQLYAAGRGAQVLVTTRGMTGHAHRRILQTAQFIMDVMSPGGFGPQGSGLAATLKVRLLHGGIRHMLLRKAGWRAQDNGVPINQEDLAATLQSFGVMVADGWDLMDLDVSPGEREAWVAGWGVIGRYLGVDPRLVPDSPRSAHGLLGQWRSRQWSSTRAGRELGHDLVAAIAGWVGPSVPLTLPASAVRYFSGDACGELLGLPRTPALADVYRMGDAVSARLPSLSTNPTRRLAFLLLKALVDVQVGGQPASFRIPEGLLHGWTARGAV